MCSTHDQVKAQMASQTANSSLDYVRQEQKVAIRVKQEETEFASVPGQVLQLWTITQLTRMHR